MDVYLARQPIFTAKGDVYGYEILYREGSDNRFNESDADYASGNALTRCFIDFGIAEITSGRKAFVNFTKEFLLNDVATIFPKDILILEILETVKVDSRVIEKCRALKKLGYLLAIDDFCYQEGYEDLIPIADIIKVDFRETSLSDQAALIKKYRRNGLYFLAEKIETPEEYQNALKMGYTYFQGYFLSKPEVGRKKKIIPFKRNRLELINLLNSEEPDFVRIASLIESDPVFSYEILKLASSAFYGQVKQVSSIRFALSLLGINEIRIWLYLAFISDLMQDSPEELLSTSMLRGKCMENMAKRAGRQELADGMLTIGIFSMMDKIRSMSMKEVTSELNLSEGICRILCGEEHKSFAACCFDALLAYEKGKWEEAEHKLEGQPVTMANLNESYLEALKWLKTINKN